MLDVLRSLAGAPIRMRMRSAARRLVTDTLKCRETQQRVLKRLLALNAGSDFAKRHRLDAVQTPADLRRQVPVADYEYYRPYVDRLKTGDHAALLGPKNRLLMFTLTSGTTSEAKFIPVTSQFLDDYRRGWRIWAIRAGDDYPRLFRQHILQLSSDHEQFQTPGGHPCGNITGLVSSLQNRIIQSMYTVPVAVAKIRQAEAKYYTALRLSMADRKVGLIMTANPSTLIHLAKLGDEHRETLIKDIADGTLTPPAATSGRSTDAVPSTVRQLLKSWLRPNRARARELEAIIMQTGGLYPRDYWPDASLLAVWTGGSAGAYVPGLTTYYGNVPVRDHGLSASEGRMTIPMQDGTASGVLDIQSHYFEFIPVAEADAARPIVLEAHQLERDQNYFILLTTSSGFCRYNIYDVVRCTGHAGTTPRLEFLNKGSNISSLTGEKITESQVVSALREASNDLKMHLSYYTVAPAWSDPPGYCLMLERSDLRGPHFADRLAAAADLALQRHNCEYGDKRQTGRLRALTPVLLPEGTWQRYAGKRQSCVGGSAEQYKHPCLTPDLQFASNLVHEFVPPAESAA